ncbi:uncharacterized protein LOC126991805 [Eriocheir sinensis]|uniref:uncharacterized protein LOC126991805 n=1 Tax=Eriocheir sinensis TaxID=95602 RepID=UPI0021C719FB|nr:uncharacterized protein LOC126991805 [Eriocheir sinensis]
MPVFRIWSSNRKTRKTVACETDIDSLLQKAKDKLCVVSRSARLVLEACGSLIEDNEVLEEVKNEVLLLLTDDEEYSPSSSKLLVHGGTAHQEQYTSTASTSTSAPQQGEQDTPIATSSAAHQGDTLADISNNSASSVEAPAGDSPDATPQRPSTLIADPPLPELSGATKAMLLEPTCSRKVWLQLIEETKNYYLKFYPLIESNPMGTYKAIGMKMVSAYPSIKREGLFPWSQFTRALSQSIRTERYKQKRKSMPHVQHAHPAPKRFALGRKQFTTIENQERELTEDEFVRHTKELCQEMKKKNLNTEHINMLLTATMVNRQSGYQHFLVDSSHQY